MEFFDLSDARADLVETFVPYPVAEADEFAGYRDNATATISPLDRLESLTLPALSDVEGGVERYVDARERAAELDENRGLPILQSGIYRNSDFSRRLRWLIPVHKPPVLVAHERTDSHRRIPPV
jgi:hypothetical protein